MDNGVIDTSVGMNHLHAGIERIETFRGLLDLPRRTVTHFVLIETLVDIQPLELAFGHVAVTLVTQTEVDRLHGVRQDRTHVIHLHLFLVAVSADDRHFVVFLVPFLDGNQSAV